MAILRDSETQLINIHITQHLWVLIRCIVTIMVRVSDIRVKIFRVKAT